MSDKPTLASYDDWTTDHEEIRDWVEARDGRPAVLRDPDADDLTFVFGDPDRAIASPVEWERFFDRFERRDRLFAYREDDDPADAYALLDRARLDPSRLEEGATDRDDSVSRS
ncbi:hypothetical protein [Salinirubrum litoreum]|uniref:1,4-alpha-glucan branching enzyme n=1 Tax=Salinirubrum litoreum TaxID=1126234 RepID=A0ABD5RFY9_9EURY|nr:hypothetical protein [Salinirubrum litoreum]